MSKKGKKYRIEVTIFSDRSPLLPVESSQSDQDLHLRSLYKLERKFAHSGGSDAFIIAATSEDQARFIAGSADDRARIWKDSSMTTCVKIAGKSIYQRSMVVLCSKGSGNA